MKFTALPRQNLWSSHICVYFKRVVRHWNRLPEEAVDASSLAMFKARWDGALSSLVYWKVPVPTAGVLELDHL